MRKYKSDFKTPSAKREKILIKDNEARLKSAQLLWDKEKQGEGKISEKTLSSGPILNWGK